MSLLRSGDNLLSEIIEFIRKSEEVIIFTPFVRVNKLQEILGTTSCSILVVRWQSGDLIQEVTDFELLYEYCKKQSISLYRNTSIHLKAVINEKNEIMFGSSNITNRGMGDQNFNLELSGINTDISLKDLIYLKSIISNSDLVDDEYFTRLFEEIHIKKKEFSKVPVVPPIVIKSKNKDYFLISSLPMTESPKKLWQIASAVDLSSISILEINCATHDLANFSVSNCEIEGEFMSDLKAEFNTHPFILALKAKIKTQESLRYGEVVNWIRENTTTAPTPRNWELKREQIVNILYEWICIFDSSFTWSIPNHSQVIFYQKS